MLLTCSLGLCLRVALLSRRSATLYLSVTKLLLHAPMMIRDSSIDRDKKMGAGSGNVVLGTSGQPRMQSSVRKRTCSYTLCFLKIKIITREGVAAPRKQTTCTMLKLSANECRTTRLRRMVAAACALETACFMGSSFPG
ncbi:hypothetical protein KCU66_g31, partial [Aureobasidium melanogenum]